MFKVEASFDNFDVYKDAVKNWDLDFRLLSKNDFSAYLNLFNSERIHLVRTKLTGKIDQFGLTPAGFRSVVVPVNYISQFFWLNKKVIGSQILIFPKNSELDGVSFDDFDVYVLSIAENLLFETIDNLNFKNVKQLFNGNEQHVFMSRSFALDFHQMATNFLNSDISNLILQEKATNNILFFLLKYLEEIRPLYKSPIQRKRDHAIKTAVEIIDLRKDMNFSISELCD